MNPLTLEWVEKAEGDLRTARRNYRVRKDPNFDAVCFHAQQAAEKYLKSELQEFGIPIPRVHSLADLLALLSTRDSTYLLIQPDTNILEGYSVQFRYPGNSANKNEAKEALQASERIRGFVRIKPGL